MYYCLTVTVLFLWGALSDENTGLSFVYAAGPCQRSLSLVRVPWYSRPYFTVSHLRLPFSLPPTTRRVTVDLFDPASTRVYDGISPWFTLYKIDTDIIENTALLNNYSAVPLLWRHVFVAAEVCSPRRGNVFSCTFPSNGHLVSLHYSGFMPDMTIFYLSRVILWVQRNINVDTKLDS
jgi:hypothetical protein